MLYFQCYQETDASDSENIDGHSVAKISDKIWWLKTGQILTYQTSGSQSLAQAFTSQTSSLTAAQAPSVPSTPRPCPQPVPSFLPLPHAFALPTRSLTLPAHPVPFPLTHTPHVHALSPVCLYIPCIPCHQHPSALSLLLILSISAPTTPALPVSTSSSEALPVTCASITAARTTQPHTVTRATTPTTQTRGCHTTAPTRLQPGAAEEDRHHRDRRHHHGERGADWCYICRSGSCLILDSIGQAVTYRH